MPGGKVTGKSSGKPSRQLLFSEALQLLRPASPAAGLNRLEQPPTMSDTEQTTTMDHILQEITAVSGSLEGMDTAITSLTTKTKSMRLDIAGFQSRVTGLEHRMSSLTELTFDPPLEFQRVHQLGPRRQYGTSRPRPIIACLLRHGQARKLLSAAQAHRPFRAESYEIRVMADYSKDTNERRKVFLALRQRLRQLEVKYCL
ncbi:hypothetical protein NDU88_002983 [Pleurodeles waltl]|uniref:Uncharacterized protein n=1 Tax=Pleurodeles waltl TaxID=8319 RepID=A0AAV7UX58_PLEWA|nr:hypothetical protein NDU88_002983 [Pleurodeles waltl]